MFKRVSSFKFKLFFVINRFIHKKKMTMNEKDRIAMERGLLFLNELTMYLG